MTHCTDDSACKRRFIPLALLIPILLVAVMVSFSVQDFDTFWHLSNGRAMVESGRLVSEELFSYTMAGAEFYNHEWLSQIILYLAYSAGGGAGLVLFKALVAVVVFILQYRTLRALGADGVSASLLAVAGIWIGLERYRERPELFSLLFLAVIVWLLVSVRAGKLGSRALYFVPVVMVGWECFHGGVYGLAYLIAFVGASTAQRWWLDRRGQPASNEPASLKQLWIVLAITLAALLASPFGLRQYGTFFTLAGKGLMVSMNEEFQPTPFGEFHLYWAVLAVSWTLVVVLYKDIDPVHAVLLLLFSLLSVRYVRATAAFGIVAMPVIGRYLSLLGRYAAWGAIWGRARYVLWGLMFLGIIYPKFFVPGSPIAFDWRVDEQRLPVGEARFIRASGLTGNMYNPGKFGGVLAYELYPERRIFMYNHHMVFEKLLEVTFDRRFLDTYKIDYAVLRLDGWIEKSLFPPELWVPVYWDDAGVVIVKNTPGHAAYLAKYGLRYYLPNIGDDALDLALRYQPARLPLIVEAARMAGYARNPRAAEFVGASVMKYRAEIPHDLAVSMLRQDLMRNPDSRGLAEALRVLGVRP